MIQSLLFSGVSIAMATKKSAILDSPSSELAQLMKKDPSGIEKDIVARGENLVGLFHDNNYTARGFSEINELKVDIIKKAIEDIAGGVITLRASTLGLTFSENRLVSYVASHGTSPKGSVVFSVSWKNIAAFKNWRADGKDTTSESDINAAIYYLTVEMSKLL